MCYEALVLLKELGHQVCLEEDLNEGSGNDRTVMRLAARDVLTDLGDDRYTVGRPHPMIDFRTRCERIVQEASRPEVGVLLLDVILGYGAHPDPAAELVACHRRGPTNSPFVGAGVGVRSIVVRLAGRPAGASTTAAGFHRGGRGRGAKQCSCRSHRLCHQPGQLNRPAIGMIGDATEKRPVGPKTGHCQRGTGGLRRNIV